MIKIFLYLIAGPLFLVSIAGYLYVQIKLKSKYDTDLDDYYYEFEDEHPDLALYNKWSKITFTSTTVSALILFVAAVI